MNLSGITNNWIWSMCTCVWWKVALRITRIKATWQSTWWGRRRPWSFHRIGRPIAKFLLVFWWCSFCSIDECSGSICRSSCLADSCASPRDGPPLGCLQFWKFLSNWRQSRDNGTFTGLPRVWSIHLMCFSNFGWRSRESKNCHRWIPFLWSGVSSDFSK